MSDNLKQNLTLFGLVMIGVGASIGSGIFRTPGLVAKSLPDANLILIVWTLGGVYTLCGALTLLNSAAYSPVQAAYIITSARRMANPSLFSTVGAIFSSSIQVQ